LANLFATKLLTPELADANRFALCQPEVFYLDTVCGITLRETTSESLPYLAAILNSAWANYYYRATTVPKANGFLIFKTMFLRDFPVRRIDFQDTVERGIHDRLTTLAERISDLQSRLEAKGSNNDYQREELLRNSASAQREIDGLIYDLYGVSARERDLVMKSSHR
jgi:hypothetical protein